MLARSAARRQRRHTARILAASFAQLQLPWLAPAQVRWSATHSSPSSQSPPNSRRRRSSTSQNSSRQTRHIATATEQQGSQAQGLYPPPPGYTNTFRNYLQDKDSSSAFKHQSNAPKSALRPYNDPIVINTTTQTPDATIKVGHGLHGTTLELLQHLRTSLQVGRLSRAEAIIQRLNEKCSPDSPELLHAHTAYLEEHLRKVALSGRGHEAFGILKEMQRWFEVEVRNKGIFVDAKMLVVMIRASIRALEGSQRDRSIRRYVEMGRSLGDDYDEVLESEDYDDNEFTILGRVASEFFVDHEKSSAGVIKERKVAEGIPGTIQREDRLPAHEIPDVDSTFQKGDGLENIQKAMKVFVDTAADVDEGTVDQRREKLYERERVLELTSVNIAMDRWRKADEDLRKMGIYTAMQTKPMGALMWQWHQALVPALEEELAECRKLLDGPATKNDSDRHHYGPYLELLSLEKVAANSILYIMARFASGRKDQTTKERQAATRLGSLAVFLGKSIEEETLAEFSSKKQSHHKATDRLRHTFAHRARSQKPHGKLSKSQQERQAILAQLEWPATAKVKLGAMLLSKLLATAQLPVTRAHPRTQEKVTQMQPAFLQKWVYNQGKKVLMFAPNPALMEKLERQPLGSLIAKRMPMIVEPKPWKSWNEGGYLHYANPILRLPDGDTSGKDYFIAAHNKGDIDQVYGGLTALGKTPWKIHHGVFKTQVEAWNTGEPVANFAPKNPKLDYPPEPAEAAGQHERKLWQDEVREIENTRAGLHSQRCFQNFQLEIAKATVNETLYFPHNMDFRGRAYPIPPYLNHMGADNVRGLLVFAKGKELGEKGLWWLKVHLATVAGHDKASMAERHQFTEDHLEDIYDSARDPLGGRRWWLQAEDAWQTLAACYELTEALDSPHPTKYISHLPIQQDGTCNGLQHYAALGGDPIGAQQVNLEPGDRPADVYTAVAEAVKAKVREDAAAGNEVAKKLDGRLTRKCVKQPVMTNVYGVTYFGAKAQVRKQLEVIFPEVQRHDKINLGMMSAYVADKIFKSLGSMFGGAQAIQTWLGQCADRISSSLTLEQIHELLKPTEKGASNKKPSQKKKLENNLEGPADSDGTAQSDRTLTRSAKPLFKSTVVWTTPLRLPVVQPYRTMGDQEIPTVLQRVRLYNPKVWHPVSKRKQLQAFPPNFIHSLDATHMLLSALKCTEQGLTFASIHDSFWTHACDVDEMSMILRDAFVAMHKDNVVGRLKEEFQTRYKGNMYLAAVQAHSEVGKKITALRKSMPKDDGQSELAQEAERARLLQSEDPKERRKGEAMETPGSIVANTNDESAFHVANEITSHQLGRIPDSAEAADYESTNTDTDDAVEADPGAEAKETAGAGETEDADVAVDSAAKAETKTENGQKKKKTKAPPRKLHVWMPLTFPDVPPKGEFDVEKLRQSTYFFH